MRTLALRAGLALALLVTTASASHAQAGAAPDRRPTLFVIDFRVSALGKQSEYEALGQGIADLLVSDLAQNPNVRVVDRENLRRILDEQDLSKTNRIDDATAVRVGKLLGAHHFIKGSVFVDPRGKVRLDAHAVSTETSGIEHVETVSGSDDDVMGLIAQLSTKLNDGLHLPPLPEVQAKPSGTSGSPTGASGSGAGSAGTSSPGSQGAASGTAVATAGTRNSSSGGKANGAAPKRANFQAVMLYSRALAEEDKGNRDAAVELYRKSLAVFPDYDNAKARLAKLEKGRS